MFFPVTASRMAKKKKSPMINLSDFFDTLGFSMSESEEESPGVLKRLPAVGKIKKFSIASEKGLWQKMGTCLDKLPEIYSDDEERSYELPPLLDNTRQPSLYVLYITIEGCPVKTWRRLQVPSTIRLIHLAHIIIRAFGWAGYHLYQFTKGSNFYKLPYCLSDAPVDADDPFLATMQPYLRKEYDMCHVTLGEVLAAKGEKMKFEYDFGDSWIHQVSLSSISSAPDAPLSIRVLSGKGPVLPKTVAVCGAMPNCLKILPVNSPNTTFLTPPKPSTSKMPTSSSKNIWRRWRKERCKSNVFGAYNMGLYMIKIHD